MGNNLKRAHHYVWQHYLRAWANDNQQIYCYDKNQDKSYVTNTKNTAQQKDFYQLNDLTIEDLFYIKSLACINTPNQPEMKESLSSWNQIYEMLFAIQKLLKLSKNSKNGESQILELLKDKLQFETIENFHCIFEDIGIKYLDLIREKDLSFFDNPNSKNEFLLFLSMQYVRTEKMQSNIRQIMSKDGKNDIALQKAFGTLVTPISATIDNHWNLISCNYAVSYSREISNHSVILLVNNSGTDFITSDQPVINTDSLSNPITKLDLYYPVSPKLAILVFDNSANKLNNPVQELSNKEVTQYNHLMASISSKFIYSHQEQINCKEKSL